MRYEVRNEIDNVVAVFWIESMAQEFASAKGYKVVNLSPDWCPSPDRWCKCDFSGFQEVEIDGISYYQKGRM